jgi:DNA-directed RNA polymerase specialized sigma24 family protein
MSSQGSVTNWIQLLETGEDSAAQQIWERYWVRLVSLAREKLRGAKRLVADEEDVALSVFDSCCRGIEQGRFPNLEGRDNLWRLLVKKTIHKSLRQIKYERRLKRGGGRVITETDLPLADEEGNAFEQLIGHEPSPEFAAQVAEEIARRIGMLEEDKLRSIAVWKMEGFTNAEIAIKLGCIEKTVGRKVERIREAWKERE